MQHNPSPLAMFPGRDELFAEHLARANRVRRVTATRNILDRDGHLLLSRGAQVDEECAARIRKQGLLCPLDSQIALSEVLTVGTLRQRFEAMFRAYPDVKFIHRALGLEPALQGLLRSTNLFPDSLWLRLSVLETSLPEVFQKAVLCAWLALMIGNQAELPDEVFESAFLAALLKDIGLLHLDPAIVERKGWLGPNEWREIQTHVVLGAALLSDVETLSPMVSEGVAEHHERSDGTGYPYALHGDDLHIVGQLVGLADSLQAVRSGPLAAAGYSLSDALFFLRMTTAPPYEELHFAAVTAIERAQLEPTVRRPAGGIGFYRDVLIARSEAISGSHNALDDLFFALNDAEAGVDTPLITMVARALGMIVDTGLVKAETSAWLMDVLEPADDQTVADMNGVELAQNEVLWQFRNTLRTLEGALRREELEGAIKQYADAAVESLARCLGSLGFRDVRETLPPHEGIRALLSRNVDSIPLAAC